MTIKLPNISLTDELYTQMGAFIDAQDAPPATAVVIREALAEFLSKRGYPVTNIHPQRGGDRRKTQCATFRPLPGHLNEEADDQVAG